MNLMTKGLEKRFAKVGSQRDKENPVVIAKFFNPAGSGNWYATEYDPKNKMFFGYVSIYGDWNEWGFFSLKELEDFESPYGTGIERDLDFEECPSSEIVTRVQPKVYG